MDIDWIREYCLALPHTTEKVQWGDDLVFKVGEKMYAVVALEPGDQWLGFKCTPEDFAPAGRATWNNSCAIPGSGTLGVTRDKRCAFA